jgi:hypothetical protein
MAEYLRRIAAKADLEDLEGKLKEMKTLTEEHLPHLHRQLHEIRTKVPNPEPRIPNPEFRTPNLETMGTGH